MSSPDETKLVLSSLRTEANKWRKISQDMGQIKADTGRLALGPSAFFFADLVSVAGHSEAYKTFHDWVVKLFDDATTEFNEIGAALDKAADQYESSDHKSAFDLTQIYGTPPPVE